MRNLTAWLTILGVCLLLSTSYLQPQKRLIWNRTASAPMGIYWLNDDPFTLGRWVVVSANSDAAQWAESQGFIGKDWPLLKQIAGVSGDEICRLDGDILVNGDVHGYAKSFDSQGLRLPIWRGCRVVSDDEIFLMNPHPDSLDGRYFGATRLSDLDGVAALVWEF